VVGGREAPECSTEMDRAASGGGRRRSKKDAAGTSQKSPTRPLHFSATFHSWAPNFRSAAAWAHAVAAYVTGSCSFVRGIFAHSVEAAASPNRASVYF
jgi:hypothetical protein